MELQVDVGHGEVVALDCEDTWTSRWVAEGIVKGGTYPLLPFVEDVDVVLDVGANCGAAAVHFARHHPEAVVHAFEPASRPRAVLERNARRYPGIVVHPFGLHRTDRTDVPLWTGEGDDTGTGSIHQRAWHAGEPEPVVLRDAGAWAREAGVDRVDILKVDVEGCEVDVLEALGGLLATVQVLYVEYDGREARREVDRILAPTHELYFTKVLLLDQGEITYVHRDLVERDDLDHTEVLRALLFG